MCLRGRRQALPLPPAMSMRSRRLDFTCCLRRDSTHPRIVVRDAASANYASLKNVSFFAMVAKIEATHLSLFVDSQAHYRIH